MSYTSESELFYWVPNEFVFDCDALSDMAWTVWLHGALLRTPSGWHSQGSLDQFRQRLPDRVNRLVAEEAKDGQLSSKYFESLKSLLNTLVASAPVASVNAGATGLTRQQVLVWLSPLLENCSDRVRQRRRNLLTMPDTCVRFTYRVALRNARIHGIQSFQFRFTLAVLMLAIAGIELNGHCNICFRKARAWTHRCDLHSRSKARNETEEERRPAIHMAKRINAAVEGAALTSRLTASLLDTATQFSDIVWPKSEFESAGWGRRLTVVLQRSPAVASMLPGDFNISNQWHALSTLRSLIDPLEFESWAWERKIEVAEGWFAYEEILQHRLSGARSLTKARRDEALALIADGLSIRAAAAQLGLSYKNLWNVLKRHDPKN